VIEGATNGLYALNGGKENLIVTKANEDNINDKLKNEEDRSSIKQILKDLNEPKLKNKLIKETEKALKGQPPKYNHKKLPYNAHALNRDKTGQVAFDYKINGGGPRGPHRAIAEPYEDKNGQKHLIFCDNTETHEYGKTNAFEKSDFNKYYSKNETTLNQNEFLIDQNQRNIQKNLLENEEENDNESKIKKD
jgi:hypothetical protein